MPLFAYLTRIFLLFIVLAFSASTLYAQGGSGFTLTTSAL